MANSTNHKSQIGGKERLLYFIFGKQYKPALLHQEKKCFRMVFPTKIISNNKCK